MTSKKESKVIQYKTVVQSQAMSKSPKQNGLIVSKGTTRIWNGVAWVDDKEVIVINATNPATKSETTHLEMQIPKESLDEVIEALKSLRDGS